MESIGPTVRSFPPDNVSRVAVALQTHSVEVLGGIR